MTIEKRKFPLLKSDTKHVFKAQVRCGNEESEWTDPIVIHTSKAAIITWREGSRINAAPRYFTNDILIRWTGLLNLSPLKTYRLFRTEEDVEPSDLTEENALADTGLIPFYHDDEIVKGTTYYYWVSCINKIEQAGPLLSEGDNFAAWGDPSKPQISECTTETLTLFPTLCHVTVKWTCDGGAEFYWVRSRLASVELWGFWHRVEHSGDPDNEQSLELPIQLSNTAYYYQVRAVNVFGVLNSEWSDEFYYPTGRDTTPPTEVTGVDVDISGWNNNIAAIKWNPKVLTGEQVERYRIYKFVTETNYGTSPPAPPTTIYDRQPITYINPNWYESGHVGDPDYLEDGKTVYVEGQGWWKCLKDKAFGTTYNDTIKDLQNIDDTVYIYYFITAVDAYEMEGEWGGFDSASTGPPAAPAEVSGVSNLVWNFANTIKVSAIACSWDEVSAADWYWVRWRVYHTNPRTGVGAYGDWCIPRYIGENQRSPTKVVHQVGSGYIQFEVTSASTNHPKGVNSRKSGAISFGTDTTPPSAVTGLRGTSVKFLGFWIATYLEWDSHPWKEGLDHYRLQKCVNGKWYEMPNCKRGIGPKTKAVDVAPGGGELIRHPIEYRVTPVDKADLTGTYAAIILTKDSINQLSDGFKGGELQK